MSAIPNPKISDIHQTCVNYLKPQQIKSYFLRHGIAFNTEFKYNLSKCRIFFNYNNQIFFCQQWLHVNDFNAIFDMFPNIVITDIIMEGSPSYNSLKMMLDKLHLKYDRMRRIYIEGDGRTLDVSILSKCVNLVKFHAVKIDLDNADALLLCNKLRQLLCIDCTLSDSQLHLRLGVFSEIKVIKWINTFPLCNLTDVCERLRMLELDDMSMSIKRMEGRNKFEVDNCGNINGVYSESMEKEGMIDCVRSISLVGHVDFDDRELLLYYMMGIEKFEVTCCDELVVIGFDRLKEIQVRGCRNFLGVIKGGCVNLRRLCVVDCESLRDLEFLKDASELAELEVRGCVNLMIDFDVLSGCGRLKKIVFSNSGSFVNLRDLCGRHSYLEVLELIKMNGLFNLDELRGCKRVNKLCLGCTDVENVEGIGLNVDLCRSLENVFVSSNSVKNLDWLGRCEELRHVYIYELSHVGNLGQLGSCLHLERVYIYGCEKISELSGFECEMLFVMNCPNLRSLKGMGNAKLKFVGINGCVDDLEFDREYLHLRKVCIGHSRINNVRDMRLCPNLESFVVVDCFMNDLDGLEQCVRLREFGMFDCNMIGGVEPLGFCRELRWFEIDGCKNLEDAKCEVLRNMECEGFVMGCKGGGVI